MTTARIAMHADGRRVQGNERQLALVAAGLMERGHELHIAARPATETWDLLAATGAHMYRARTPGAADVLSVPRLVRWMRRVQPDAILLTSWRRMPLLSLLSRVAGLNNVVLRVGMTHDVPPGVSGAHYRYGLRWLVDRVWVNSTSVRDHLIGAAGLRRERVHLIPNALDPVLPRPAPLREELGISPDARIIAGVGALTHRKGFDTLIRAVAGMGNVHVVICGDGPEAAALMALATAGHMRQRVHLLGQCDDVPGVLAASDAFVLSSRAEGFSVAMMEAMYLGLPVVAADVGGARDALLGDELRPAAGWIVPPDDVHALSRVLADLLPNLRSAETRRRAAEAARRAAHDYTPQALARNAERVLLASSCAKPPDGSPLLT